MLLNLGLNKLWHVHLNEEESCFCKIIKPEARQKNLKTSMRAVLLDLPTFLKAAMMACYLNWTMCLCVYYGMVDLVHGSVQMLLNVLAFFLSMSQDIRGFNISVCSRVQTCFCLGACNHVLVSC